MVIEFKMLLISELCCLVLVFENFAKKWLNGSMLPCVVKKLQMGVVERENLYIKHKIRLIALFYF